MTTEGAPIEVQHHASLREHHTFGLPAVASTLVRVATEADLRRVFEHPQYGRAPKLVLGGGSNTVFTRDVEALVLKIEIPGRGLLREEPDAWVLEAGAGESWPDLVAWSLCQGWPGLENLALIPGTVGAAPVQNIGAYGVELAERLHEVDIFDLESGRSSTLDAAQCDLGYRDSVFKHALGRHWVITRVRLRLPRPWQPVLGYLDLQRRMQETATPRPDAHIVFDWVCEIRRAKLPDPVRVGNAGSFFKNPVVSADQCRDIIGRDPEVVHYPLPGGRVKLAAGWLIDACGWRGKSVGRAGVHERQALVLVNRGSASGAEVLTLARAIQESVYGRFGIRLETEPVIV